MKPEIIDRFEGKYRFLSNFYPSEIRFGKITYPTVEHAFQAQKTLDQNTRIKISNAATPYVAKVQGNRVKLRPMWDEIKVTIMAAILNEKFNVQDLSEKLLDTGSAILIEGNTHRDRYWGACSAGNGTMWEGRTHFWYGENVLGTLLMIQRDLLKT